MKRELLIFLGGATWAIFVFWTFGLLVGPEKEIVHKEPGHFVETQVIHDTLFIVKEWPPVLQLTGTTYQPTVAQCDSTPFNTADGSFINAVELQYRKLRWCAVSRDLLKHKGGPFEYGDAITVVCEEQFYCDRWVVHDCMAAKYNNCIDFLTWFDRPRIGRDPNILVFK